MRKLLTILFFSLCYVLSQAQYNPKVYVRGYVLNETQQAVEMVNIFEHTQTEGTTTNENGYYELALQKADTFKITFSCIGYKSVEKTFSTDKESVTLNITLEEDATELATIEVNSQGHQTIMMQKVDASKIKYLAGPSNSIESLLSTFAGVNSTNEMSTQYSVRGGNFDENSVYVNNIEVYRPLLIRAGQQEGLSFINPDMVSSVEFSSGGFGAQYSDKMSSVLDIKYKTPTKFEASTSVSLLGATAYVGSASKNFTQIHGLRYKTSNYLLGTLDTKGEYAQNFIDYQTYLTFRFSDKWSASFLGNISQNSYRFIPKDRETTFGTFQSSRNFKVYFEGQEDDKFRTLFGAFTVDYKPLKNLKFSFMASAFNTFEKETYDITGEYWLSDVDISNNTTDESEATTLGSGTYHEHARNKLSATVANLSYLGEFNKGNHLLKFGLSGQGEFIEDEINEWEFRDSAGYSLPFNPDQVNLIYNLTSKNSMKSWRLSAFAQEYYKLRRNHGLWTLSGGIRASYWSFNEEWLISPRLAVSLYPKWKADFTFRFAGGLYYQSPFYKELRLETTDADGNSTITLNKNIKAQRSLHLVLGADYHFRLFKRPFKLTLEGYYKPSDHVISYYIDNVRVRYSGKNDAKAYVAGIDLKLFGEFVPGTDSWISFSWMRCREDILNDSYNVYSNTGTYLGKVYPGYISRPNEQRYSISMFYQDYFPNHPEYKVYLKMIWADGLPFGAPHSERYQATFRTKAYRRVDIGASRDFVAGREKFMRKSKVVKSWALNFEIFNLLNIKNINSYYWVTDIYNNQNAVPNYLSGILFNFKVTVDF